MATNVYIDGFNLYNGCIKGSNVKWLDLSVFSAALLGKSHTLGTVNYFTAIVFDSTNNPDQSKRQRNYNRALAATGVQIYLGEFKQNRKTVVLVRRSPSNGLLREAALVREEKGTDVKLATHLVWDACHDPHMTAALVISNDADLQESIDMARRLGKQVVTVNPHHGDPQPDHLSGDDRRIIDQRHLRRSQLPDAVTDAHGHQIRKPTRW